MRTYIIILFVILLAQSTSSVRGDTFGSGVNTFEIDFVTIGDPNNPADDPGLYNPFIVGSVAYNYRIGKYEIPEDAIDKTNALGGLGIVHDGRGANKPATQLTWLQAAKFVNWLNTSTGNSAAYKFSSSGDFELWQPGDPGYNPSNLYRNSLAKYFLPSTDEWYKAAYYDPILGSYYDYPTGSDTVPTAVSQGTAPDTAVYDQGGPGRPGSGSPADVTQAGGLSPYGTMAQGGNVFEWEETDHDLVNDDPSASVTRGFSGGYWDNAYLTLNSTFYRSNGAADFSDDVIGFRVASVVPEPGAIFLLSFGSIVFVAQRRRM